MLMWGLLPLGGRARATIVASPIRIGASVLMSCLSPSLFRDECVFEDIAAMDDFSNQGGFRYITQMMRPSEVSLCIW